MDRRAMEKQMLDVARVLQERDFDSVDEANAFLQEMLASGGPPPRPALTPLERAQDLMYEAWDASGKERTELARRALAISEDCADAYVLLAEETADGPDEAKRLYEQGVSAGERALPSQTFAEEVGNFWSIIETRPYMRARLGLAQCLWLTGERRAALEHYQALLRLNPNDNQGVRWLLVTCLLEEGDDEAVGKLLSQYKDELSTTWLYSRALWTFRREGPSRKANASLKKAMKANPFVPSYLIGLSELPDALPEFIGFGGEDEAIAYAADAMNAWHATEGALDWLLAGDSQGTSAGTNALKKELLKVVEHQIRANDPPETREALQRLREAGYSRPAALQLIAVALAQELNHMLTSETPFDRGRFRRFLDELE